MKVVGDCFCTDASKERSCELWRISLCLDLNSPTEPLWVVKRTLFTRSVQKHMEQINRCSSQDRFQLSRAKERLSSNQLGSYSFRIFWVIPIYISCLGEGYNAVLPWSSRNDLWTMKLSITWERAGNDWIFHFWWTAPLKKTASFPSCHFQLLEVTFLFFVFFLLFYWKYVIYKRFFFKKSNPAYFIK